MEYLKGCEKKQLLDPLQNLVNFFRTKILSFRYSQKTMTEWGITNQIIEKFNFPQILEAIPNYVNQTHRKQLTQNLENLLRESESVDLNKKIENFLAWYNFRVPIDSDYYSSLMSDSADEKWNSVKIDPFKIIKSVSFIRQKTKEACWELLDSNDVSFSEINFLSLGRKDVDDFLNLQSLAFASMEQQNLYVLNPEQTLPVDKYFLERIIAQKSGRFYGIRKNGKLVAGCVAEKLDETNNIHFRAGVVHPDFQSSGLVKNLLTRVVKNELKTFGNTNFSLSVHSENKFSKKAALGRNFKEASGSSENVWEKLILDMNGKENAIETYEFIRGYFGEKFARFLCNLDR